MGDPCYRYHKDHLTGMIFDSDDLPSEEDGWFDSPKKAGRVVEVLPSIDTAPLSSEFPDPMPFANVRAYVSAVDPQIPKPLVGDARAASGKTEDELEALDKEIASVKRRALQYYARRKFNKELARNGEPGKLMEACMALDAGGDPK